MRVEIVHHQMPLRSRRTLREQPFEIASKILFRAGLSEVGEHGSGGHIETGNYGLRTVANVLEFPAFHPAGAHRKGWGSAFDGLNASHLIDRDRLDAGCGAFDRKPIGLADILTFFLEMLILLGRQPATHAVRFQIGIFLKSARRPVAKSIRQCRV